MKARKIQRYGWKPDLPDLRDHYFQISELQLVEALPNNVNLRPKFPKVYDQGQLGSCTANAIAGALEFLMMKEAYLGGPAINPEGTPRFKPFTPSRLFIYYNERAIEGTVDHDSGAQLRDGIASVAKQGVCDHTLWPYDTAKFAEKPPDSAYVQAVHFRAVQYQRIPRALAMMKSVLASGYPFVFGITVYDSFESQAVAQTGVVPMPSPDEDVIGGHAVCAAGYDDDQRQFLVRNSWGEDWGQKGYFVLPYDYVTNENLSDDFWTVKLITL